MSLSVCVLDYNVTYFFETTCWVLLEVTVLVNNKLSDLNFHVDTTPSFTTKINIISRRTAGCCTVLFRCKSADRTQTSPNNSISFPEKDIYFVARTWEKLKCWTYMSWASLCVWHYDVVAQRYVALWRTWRYKALGAEDCHDSVWPK